MANDLNVSYPGRDLLEFLRSAGINTTDSVPTEQHLALVSAAISDVSNSKVNRDQGETEFLFPGGAHFNVKSGLWNALVAGFTAAVAVHDLTGITWIIVGAQALEALDKVRNSLCYLSPGQVSIYHAIADITVRKRRERLQELGARADEVAAELNARENPKDPYLAESIADHLDDLAEHGVLTKSVDSSQRTVYRLVL